MEGPGEFSQPYPSTTDKTVDLLLSHYRNTGEELSRHLATV